MASGSDAPLYLDSSAIVKLIAREAESRALADVVAGAAGIVTSELTLAEVPRAVRRRTTGVSEADRTTLEQEATRVLERAAFVPVDRELLLRAGAIGPAPLRTLDAIHVAAALSLGPALGAFLTYDHRQADAAAQNGLRVRAPA